MKNIKTESPPTYGQVPVIMSTTEIRDKEDVVIKEALAILAGRLHKEDLLHATSSDAAFDYLKLKVATREHEVFGILFLDNQHHLLKDVELFRGTIDGASVYPREVLKEALRHNAAAVIFYHNHPSGLAEPSSSDDAITARLKAALQVVEIRVLDHIIVGGLDAYSYSSHGKL